jgi:hypothetical protein
MVVKNDNLVLALPNGLFMSPPLIGYILLILIQCIEYYNSVITCWDATIEVAKENSIVVMFRNCWNSGALTLLHTDSLCTLALTHAILNFVTTGF